MRTHGCSAEQHVSPLRGAGDGVWRSVPPRAVPRRRRLVVQRGARGRRRRCDGHDSRHRDDLQPKYGEEAAARFDRLGAIGGRRRDGAQTSAARSTASSSISLTPPGKQNIRRNRELLHAVCGAAPLAPGGELLIALDGGQGGCVLCGNQSLSQVLASMAWAPEI